MIIWNTTSLPESAERGTVGNPYYLVHIEGFGATQAMFIEGEWCNCYASKLTVPVLGWTEINLNDGPYNNLNFSTAMLLAQNEGMVVTNSAWKEKGIAVKFNPHSGFMVVWLHAPDLDQGLYPSDYSPFGKDYLLEDWEVVNGN